MAIYLDYALGTSELIVGRRVRQMQRTLRGYAGAEGLTGMNMGTRGFQVPITLTLRSSGATYAVAREAMENLIYIVEQLQYLAAGSYLYGNIQYDNCVWSAPQLLPIAPDGKQYAWNGAQVRCKMTITLIGLI